MLQAKNRLKTDKDFQLLARRGRSVTLAFLTLKYMPNQLPYSRFGFVVSTRTDKRAVVRNRAKRKVREVIRLNWPKIVAGYDVMMIIRKGADRESQIEIKGLLGDLLDRAGLLKAWETL